MGKSAILSVRIVSNGRDAEKGMDRTARKLTDIGKAGARSGVELSRMYDHLDGLADTTMRVGLLSSALLSLTSHAAGVVRSMAPLVGVTAALPGAIAVAGAAVGTFKVATMGFSDAVEAAGKSTEEFEKATANMAPAMRDAARAVGDVGKAYSGDVRAVQSSFWLGLDAMVKTVADATLPRLFRRMESTAGVMNTLVQSLGAGVVEASRLGVIEEVFAATDRVLKSLAPAMAPVVVGLAEITKGSAKLIGGWDGAGAAAQRFKAWATRISSDGTLARWFAQGAEVAGQLGSIIKSVASILLSVGKAASEAGGAAGVGGLAENLQRLAEAVARPEVQQGMREAFTTANTIMKQVTSVVIALLPHIVRFAPVLLAAAAAWRVFSAASALFKGAQMVGTFLRIGPAVTGAVGAVGRFYSGLTSASAAASAFSGKAGTLGGAVRTAGSAIASGVTSLAAYAAAAARAGAAAAVAAARVVAGWVAAAAAAVASAAVQAAAWARTAAAAMASAVRIAAAWVLSLGPVGLVIAAIAGIVAAFVIAYNKCGWFRDGVNAAMANIKSWVGSVVSWIKSAWSSAWNLAQRGAVLFVSGAVSAIGRIRSTVSSIVAGIKAGFTSAWSSAKAGAEGFRRTVSGAMERVRAIIDSVRAAAARALDIASSAASKVNPFSWFAMGTYAPQRHMLPDVGQPFYMTAAIIDSGASAFSRSGSVRTEQTVVNITIQGAIDPNETARQIRRLLERDGVRDGRFSLGVSARRA